MTASLGSEGSERVKITPRQLPDKGPYLRGHFVHNLCRNLRTYPQFVDDTPTTCGVRFMSDARYIVVKPWYKLVQRVKQSDPLTGDLSGGSRSLAGELEPSKAVRFLSKGRSEHRRTRWQAKRLRLKIIVTQDRASTCPSPTRISTPGRRFPNRVPREQARSERAQREHHVPVLPDHLL